MKKIGLVGHRGDNYMQIRNATTDDLSVIQRLNHELFLSDNAWNGDLDCDWPYNEEGEKYFREAIESERYISVVAEIDGKVIGYLNGFIRKPNGAYLGKRAEIDNMCVTEMVRGHGIGTALINEFKKWAKNNDVERIMVEAFSANEKAIAFYQKNGLSTYATVLTEEIT